MTEEFLRMLSAAENGDAEKQYRVARAYADGDEALGVQKDEMQAMEWYQKAGKPSGSLAAMHDGALLYVKMMEDNGVQPDPNMYVQLISMAAKHGYAPSQLWMGETCFDLKRYDDALSFLKSAAESGFEDETVAADAKRLLGVMYADGLGIAQDRVKAFNLINEACKTPTAKEYNRSALKVLAVCYHYGYGTPVDYAQARKYYGMAKLAGHNNVDNSLKQLDIDEKKPAHAPAAAKSGINWGLAIALLILFPPAGLIYILTKK